MGHVNELTMALLILPVTRNSVWFLLFGVPYERAIKYHRWMARQLLITMTGEALFDGESVVDVHGTGSADEILVVIPLSVCVAHMLLWWWAWGQEGTW